MTTPPQGMKAHRPGLRNDVQMSVMDDYLDELPPDQKAAFQRVREIVAELVPDAEEGTSYGMSALLYAGRPLVRARQGHDPLRPAREHTVDRAGQRLLAAVLQLSSS